MTAALVLVCGLILGSFLNVCIHRLPLGESVVTPGSRCPRCLAPVRPWQNVPVVSWVVLRGRCASCRAPISWRYPLVEALTGVLMLALWRAFGADPAFAVSAIFTAMLIVLFFTDYDHQLLPDRVTLSGFGIGLALAYVNPFLGDPGWRRLVAACAGAALGSGILWGIGALYTRLRGVEAMGFGDVKMMAMVGAFVGTALTLFTILVGSVLGSVIGIVVMRFAGKDRDYELPFGTFLSLGAILAVLYGNELIRLYLNLVNIN